MGRKLIIGVDVDGTTLDSSPAWWNWLHHMTESPPVNSTLAGFMSYKRMLNQKIDYDLTKYFNDPINHNVDKFDFWRHTGVYDTIEPVEGAVENIKKLMSDGHEIVFVTHNKGNGGRSKHMNLIRHFGYDNFDYVVTKEKYRVNIDILIDDRHDFLSPCQARGIQGFLIETPFTQRTELHEGVVRCKNWDEIYDCIQNWKVEFVMKHHIPHY